MSRAPRSARPYAAPAAHPDLEGDPPPDQPESDAAAETPQWYRRLLSHHPGASLLLDRSLRCLVAEGAGLGGLGLSRDALQGKTIEQALAPTMRRQLEPALRDALAGRLASLELRFGDRIHLVLCSPMRDTDGTVRAASLVAQDVTDQKRAEERQRFLADATSLLTSTLDYRKRLASLARLCVPVLADYCILDMLDEHGELVRIEAAHADPDKEPLVRRLLDFPPVQARAEGVSRAMRTGESILSPRVDLHTLQKSAQSAEHLEIVLALEPRSFLVVPMQVKGKVMGAISFVMAGSGRDFAAADLTLAEELAARAAHAIENARLYQKAQQAVRAREEVLSVVSHELRNPLAASLISLEALLDAPDEELLSSVQRGRVEAAHRFTRQMVRLVDDLLDVTRVETGHLSVRRRPEEIASMVGEAADMVRPMAKQRGITIREELSASLPPVLADRGRVIQVLGNLLGNAVKFVPDLGTVVVGAKRSGSAVRFHVSDNGPGIRPEEIPDLFDRSRRIRTDPGGTGLGLAIARGIVRAHGGEIGVDSEPGSGSTFWFSLPAAGASDEVASTVDFSGSLETMFARPRDPEPMEARRRPPLTERRETARRRSRFLQDLALPTQSPAGSDRDIEERLRHRIMSALHLGDLYPGDRLPSIRRVAAVFGTTHHAVARVYERLAAEGLVESRQRSGVFVADPSRTAGPPLTESGRWVAAVLTGAFEHRIKIPTLPELLRRWTASVRPRCICVESDLDHQVALCTQISQQFGFECSPLEPGELPPVDSAGLVSPEEVPEQLKDVDLFVTTAFHAPALRAVADSMRKPLVVASADPDVARTVEERLARGPLTLVCADRRFGDRIGSLRGSGTGGRLRVVLASDQGALAALSSSEPVLLTRAAREQLQRTDLRLLVPHYPSFSPDYARMLSELLVQFNLAAQRVFG